MDFKPNTHQGPNYYEAKPIPTIRETIKAERDSSIRPGFFPNPNRTRYICMEDGRTVLEELHQKESTGGELARLHVDVEPSDAENIENDTWMTRYRSEVPGTYYARFSIRKDSFEDIHGVPYEQIAPITDTISRDTVEVSIAAIVQRWQR